MLFINHLNDLKYSISRYIRGDSYPITEAFSSRPWAPLIFRWTDFFCFGRLVTRWKGVPTEATTVDFDAVY